ncbi:MAG: hypothetical protein ACI33K_05150 [Clostridiaceae bacterium]
MITVRIVTPQGLYKETEASIINVVTTGGELGILPNHLPLAAILKTSRLKLTEKEGRQEYMVAEGLIYFKKNQATVLTSNVDYIP